uniref:Tetraspanin n=1 Tax=Glossina brevipalpis TaxID=37001 RepID=A0A1A9WBV4_9MUSC
MYSSENLVSYACVRSLLILFNIGFWLSGLSLIWIGAWLQTDFENYLKISENYSEHAPGILIIMGGIIIFVTSLTCSCFVKIRSSELVVNGGVLITLLFSLISLSVYINTYKDQVMNGINDGISKEINNYNFSRSTNNDNLIDFVQKNGCAYKLKNVINKHFTALGITTSAIALFPFFGAVLSFGLSLMYNKGGGYEMIV